MHIAASVAVPAVVAEAVSDQAVLEGRSLLLGAQRILRPQNGG